MRRIRLTLAYDGTEFHGWQEQPGLPTIQGCLEQALAAIEGKPVHAAGSGRTDAGVHALAQVAGVTIENPIPLENLQRALNRLLPWQIRVLDVRLAPPDFHPRHHAIAKTYEYRIFRGGICPPFERRYVHHFPYPLNESQMAVAAPLFVGEHDFTAFAAADEKVALGGSKVRRIFSSTLERNGQRLVFRVRGGGFLKHMVRTMVGSLLEVGKNNMTLENLLGYLTAGGPGKAGPAAPASGLFLVSVEYRGDGT